MSDLFSKEDVERIAALAMIDLREDEVERLAKDLNVINDSISSVTAAVEEAEKATGKKIEPTSHPLNLGNVLREDIPATLEDDLLSAKDATAGGPKVENDQFVAPQILGED